MDSAQKKYIIDNPDLIAEWDWEKNKEFGLNPTSITYGSARSVWWKCVNGHSWMATPNDRSRGRQCPECAKIMRKITRTRNMISNRGSLADNNPQLAIQWHPTKNGNLLPQNVLVNSAMKVWWQCEKGHEWDAAINSRNRGVGCPICSGHRILIGYNDLSTVNPELATQWHPTENGTLTPADVTIHCGTFVTWICEKGHSWKARIADRTSGNGCPICSGHKVLLGFNDLGSINPELAAQWYPTKNGYLTPKDVTANSNKEIWWQCRNGHEWRTTVSHRSSGTGCPICASEARTSFPEQAIYFYFKRVTAAHSRYMIAPRTEIDVYLPEYKLGIEYDGEYFHKGEQSNAREKKKQETLCDLGIRLVRIKESFEAKQTDPTNTIIYCRPGSKDSELTETIQQLFEHINQMAHLSLHTDINISRDRSKIYEQYILEEKADSLSVKNRSLQCSGILQKMANYHRKT